MQNQPCLHTKVYYFIETWYFLIILLFYSRGSIYLIDCKLLYEKTKRKGFISPSSQGIASNNEKKDLFFCGLCLCSTVQYAVTAERCHSHVGKKSFSYLLECHILYSYASDLLSLTDLSGLTRAFRRYIGSWGLVKCRRSCVQYSWPWHVPSCQYLGI